MRKVIIGAAILAAGFAAVRFGPAMAQRGMKKCQDHFGAMPAVCQEACGHAKEPMGAATV